jgi:predicted transcriptional regulator
LGNCTAYESLVSDHYTNYACTHIYVTYNGPQKVTRACDVGTYSWKKVEVETDTHTEATHQHTQNQNVHVHQAFESSAYRN